MINSSKAPIALPFTLRPKLNKKKNKFMCVTLSAIVLRHHEEKLNDRWKANFCVLFDKVLLAVRDSNTFFSTSLDKRSHICPWTALFSIVIRCPIRDKMFSPVWIMVCEHAWLHGTERRTLGTTHLTRSSLLVDSKTRCQTTT